MPEQFDRLTDFVLQAGRLADPSMIREQGMRRVRRRTAGRIALGAGTFALVASTGAILATSTPGDAKTGAPTYTGASTSGTAQPLLPCAGGSYRVTGVPESPSSPTAFATKSTETEVPGYQIHLASRLSSGAAGASEAIGPTPTAVPYSANPGKPITFVRDGWCMQVTFTDPEGTSLVGLVGPAGTDTVHELRQFGFTNVTNYILPSQTVPAGDTIDVQDAQGDSVAGRALIPATTPLVVIISSGPQH